MQCAELELDGWLRREEDAMTHRTAFGELFWFLVLDKERQTENALKYRAPFGTIKCVISVVVNVFISHLPNNHISRKNSRTASVDARRRRSAVCGQLSNELRRFT